MSYTLRVSLGVIPIVLIGSPVVFAVGVFVWCIVKGLIIAFA